MMNDIESSALNQINQTARRSSETLIVLTGASGSGKTTIVDNISAHNPQIQCLHFDDIGIPSSEQMIAECGSLEEWQRLQTIQWFSKISKIHLTKGSVVFEGQMRIGFILDALKASSLKAHIFLIDCTDDERFRRLKQERNQPELCTDEMLNWAAYLRAEARKHGLQIVDTDAQDITSVSRAIFRMLLENNKGPREETALNTIKSEVVEAFGVSEEAGFEGPRINLGPCAFAYDFLSVWNKLSPKLVHIVFVMEKRSGDCWRVAIRLPSGKLFDGGVGIHDDAHYDQDLFEIEDMPLIDMELLDERAYGLNRGYTKHCPKFNRETMRKIIVEQLEWLFDSSHFHSIEKKYFD